MSFARQYFVAALVLGLGIPSLAWADTVYLKNGAWIDGIVKSRSEKAIEIEIGDIGKVEIAADEIDQVEKNNRTGAEKRRTPEEKDKKPDVKIVTKDGKRVVTTDASAKDEATTVPLGDSKPAPTAAATSKDSAPDEKDEKAEKVEKKEAKKIDPELKARIENLVQDLQKQKAQFRTRAERQLKAIGQPAIPFLLPLAHHEADLTRTAVFRLLNEMGDDSVIESCIDALQDSSEYVRDFANRTLERVTSEHFGFQASASPRRRDVAVEKWKKWWEKEKDDMAAAEKLKR